MQDPYTGQAGSYLVDPEAGIRVPAEDWLLYQYDKAAYLADRAAAAQAFARAADKTARPRSNPKPAQE